MEKLCAFCNHFKIEGGAADTYGTGGEDAPECKMRMWEKLGTHFYTFKRNDERGFRKMLLTAERCDKYDQVKS